MHVYDAYDVQQRLQSYSICTENRETGTGIQCVCFEKQRRTFKKVEDSCEEHFSPLLPDNNETLMSFTNHR